MLIPVQASVSPLKKLEYSEAVTALEKHRKPDLWIYSNNVNTSETQCEPVKTAHCGSFKYLSYRGR
jgi:hypothetical protein